MRRKPRRLWLSMLASAVMASPTWAMSVLKYAVYDPFDALCSRSLRLDLREPGQLFPLLDFLRNEIGQRLGVAGKWRRVRGGDVLPRRLHLADLGEPRFQLPHDRLRRTGRQQHAPHRCDVELRNLRSLRHGRQIDALHALAGGDREPAHLAAGAKRRARG